MDDTNNSGTLLALQVIDVNKFYGRGPSAYHVLHSLNMDVPQGTIYGLLGASGCGKTTLLRCALGRLPIQSGHILILGKPPGTRGHIVPGKGVGYMPQELALQLEMTMRETMYYFGILFKINLKYIKKRTDFLMEFLSIPSADKLCGQMSGGQKRRVSLGIALLHEPPMLILDEPTVGVDTMLRAKIWDHLLEITSTGNNTIIITTHYIEEARQAHMVGLMRSGRLLAQAKPDDLIKSYSVSTLEDVFLKLSEQQDLQLSKKPAKGASIQQDDDPSEHTPLLGNNVDTVQYPSYFSGIHLNMPQLPSLSNITAQSMKETLKFIRQPLLLFFLILNPTIQLSFVLLSYGHDLTDVTVYYTYHDTSYHSDFFNGTFDLGKSFLSHIDDDTLDLNYADNMAEGINKIQEGEAWGYFSVPKNYSRNFIERLVTVCEGVEDGSSVSPSEVSGAAIELILDVTDVQIYYTINDTLNAAIMKMRRDFLRNTSIPEFYFNPVIKVNNYVYGGPNIEYKDFTAPNMIAGLTLAVAIPLTVTNLIMERKGGLFDRSWVAGVTTIETVLSQVITYCFMVLMQVLVLTMFTLYVFDIEREGAIPLVILIAVMEGLCGIAIGLALSAFMSDEGSALQTSIALFYPILLIGGVFWPTESFDKWMKYIAYLSPVSYPAEGIRDILIKGWGVADEPVYLGMIVLVTWIIVLLIMTCIGMQIMKS
ncbi:ABC transporter G family member 20-like [Dysidea avara]|uniref:ABC transporter G family member 20-like n=1 Tax=Dysidea avara TaxID=196820 RepID=UPI00332AB612